MEDMEWGKEWIRWTGRCNGGILEETISLTVMEDGGLGSRIWTGLLLLLLSLLDDVWIELTFRRLSERYILFSNLSNLEFWVRMGLYVWNLIGIGGVVG
jgi:hypothetical protein